MNKRYIDFVPTKGSKIEPRPVRKPIRTVTQSKPASLASDAYRNTVRKTIKTSEKTVNRTRSVEPELGVIEDLGKGTSNKISEGKVFSANKKEEIKTIKSKKVGIEEKAEKRPEFNKLKKNDTFNTPKTRFINQDKVVKRPLSKNFYPKKAVVADEKPKGPVTIIEKPEKSHTSLIVVIILTIILGAAAGTVAFLLLPR